MLTSLRLSDYMHNANPETPIEETMRAMAELQALALAPAPALCLPFTDVT